MTQDTQQSSRTRAEIIRAQAEQDKTQFISQVHQHMVKGKDIELAKTVGLRVCELLSYLPVIAAELAERNEHDTAAEARATAAETFVRGIEAQLGLSSGLVTPQGKPAVNVPTR